ncbi:MAG TPA: hypothetical protein VG052_03745 [Puia sp.]|nr:hypothetical protein [Puia sp.]
MFRTSHLCVGKSIEPRFNIPIPKNYTLCRSNILTWETPIQIYEIRWPVLEPLYLGMIYSE